MSRKFGAFDPASTASTTVVTVTTTARGIVEAVAQNFFPFESTAANLASGDGVFTSVGAFSYSSAVGTPYGAGTALRVEGGAHMTITSAGAVQMMEFSSAFTFEFWAYRETGANSATSMQIFDSRNNNDNPNNCFLVSFNSGKLVVSPGASGGANQQIASTAGVLNAWQHYAIARDSSMQMRMFYDGVKKYDASYTVVSDNKATGGAPHFFETVNNTFPFTGYIRDLRIFKDVCIYTKAFPVTTQPLQATSNNIGISTSATTDTRTHSHVWNYTDVYDARFADTWPTENASRFNTTLKAWGAGGGGAWWNGGSAGSGGAGGFAKASANLTTGSQGYVVVGTAGAPAGSNNAGSKSSEEGGNGSANKMTYHRGGIGGGFSGVFTGNGGGDVTQANALVIAGGGGGGSSFDRTGEDESGGGGGGTTGGDGVNAPNGGGGGTQSAGGSSTDGTAGTALKGGNVATSESTNKAAGGGGGGYYGGGAGSVTGSSDAEETGGGGGGSGFVKSGFIETVNINGSNGTAGSTTGKVTPIASAASADADYSSGFGLGGGFNSTGGNGYVVIIDGAGTNVFTSTQAYTIR